MDKFYAKKACSKEEDYIDLYPKNYTVKPVANRIDLYLLDEIDSVDRYAAWVPLIQGSTEYDHIIVHISSPGGLLDVSLQLYESLLLSPALVEVSVEGPCCSGASMIMMAADILSITPASYVMCHAFRGGFVGKANEIFANSEFSKPWFQSVVTDVYKDFLSKAEIDRMLNGEDFYFTAQEVLDRFTKVIEARKKAAAARAKFQKKVQQSVDSVFSEQKDILVKSKSEETKASSTKKSKTKETKEKSEKKPAKQPAKKQSEKPEKSE